MAVGHSVNPNPGNNGKLSKEHNEQLVNNALQKAASATGQTVSASFEQTLSVAQSYANGEGFFGRSDGSGTDSFSNIALNAAQGIAAPGLSQSVDAAHLFHDAGLQLNNAGANYSQEMMAIMQELMGALQEQNFHYWDPQKKYDAINQLRRYTPGLVDDVNKGEHAKTLPHHPQYKQELQARSQQSFQFLTVSVASYTQFAVEGHVEAAEGLKDTFEGVSEQTLESHGELYQHFSMSFSSIFAVNVTETQVAEDPAKARLSRLQDDLLIFLEGKDSAVADKILAQIYSVLENAEIAEDASDVSDVNEDEISVV